MDAKSLFVSQKDSFLSKKVSGPERNRKEYFIFEMTQSLEV